MKTFITVLIAGVALASVAQACDYDYMFEAAYVDQQISAGITEAQARAAQDAALAVRDENLQAARQAFVGRFGRALGMTPVLAQASFISSEKVVTDADKRSVADAQNP